MVFRTMIAVCCAMLMLGGVVAAQEGEKKPEKGPRMDIVFAIDVSGSMEQIIAATQQKVWAIVNEMVKAKPTPELRVGLIAYRGEQEDCYGNRGFKVWDLTGDLDKMYGNLMALKTDGGSRECVGRAIHEATNSLAWDGSKDALKVLFVMGNEEANQDSNPSVYGYEVSSKAAIQKGININTVYCGTTGGVEQGWREIARLADGSFSQIGLEGRTIQISTPFDGKIGELNGKLNDTYLGYGMAGEESKARQSAMDKAAESAAPSAAAERAVAKAGKAYQASEWDLVDRKKNDAQFKIGDLKEEELPEAMKKMTAEEREKYLGEKIKERETVQKELQELAQKRDVYIKDEMKKQNLGEGTVDQTIINSLRGQAVKKGFKFEEAK